MAEPETPAGTPPKATSDDILAAIYSLVAVVQALEEWHHADSAIMPTQAPDNPEEEAQVA